MPCLVIITINIISISIIILIKVINFYVCVCRTRTPVQLERPEAEVNPPLSSDALLHQAVEKEDKKSWDANTSTQLREEARPGGAETRKGILLLTLQAVEPREKVEQEDPGRSPGEKTKGPGQAQ